MNVFGPLYDRVMGWSRHRHAPRILAGLSFAESSFFPVPPDVMLAPMAAARAQQWWKLALLTTVASVLGGVFGYAIGWFAFESVAPWLEAHGKADAMTAAREWFDEWGVWIMLVAGFSPIPYKVFTVTAGALAMPLAPFVVASLVGRGARFFLVAALMARLGPYAERHWRPNFEWIGWGSVVVLLAAIVAVTVWRNGT
ncbi:MAG: YqaA family protein [Thioalkalivibrionaceae bacterium]